jgi:hypothetical protein
VNLKKKLNTLTDGSAGLYIFYSKKFSIFLYRCLSDWQSEGETVSQFFLSDSLLYFVSFFDAKKRVH